MQESNDIILIVSSASASILLLLLIIIVILFRLHKKRMINEKMVEFYKTSFQKNLLRSQIEIQEAAFKSISQDIHDNVGLTLTLAKLKIGTLKKFPDPEIIEASIQSDELITNAIEDLRSISRNMNPEVVKSVGLLTALNEEAKRINKTKLVKIHIEASGDSFFLNSEKDLLIFRICQEMFNNSLKHSFATIITLTLHYKEDWVYLTFRDNGIGFQNQKDKRNTGLGLLNLESRTKLIKGTLQINTNSSGTIITLTIPPEKNNIK